MLLVTLFFLSGGVLFLGSQGIDVDEIDAEEEFQFGVRAFHNGRYNEAILSFTRSLSFEDDTRTRYWLGRAYYFGGFVDAALNQWQYIIDGREGSAQLRALIDIVSARQGVVPELYEPGEWTVMSELSGRQGERSLFERPVSVEPRRDGSFYLTSFAGRDVLLLNPNGVLQRRLRGGLEGFDRPFDVHDPGGDFIFVSEFGADRIAKVNPRGNKIATFGDSGTGDGGLRGPQYLASDGERFLYVSDWGNGRVCVFDFDGEFIQSFGASEQAGDFEGLSEPTGLVWLNDRLYVADAEDGNIHVFDDGGNHRRSIEGLGLESPEKMTVGADGTLLIADGSRLVEVDLENETVRELSELAGSSDGVTGAALDANGNLLASDFDRSQVYFLSRVPSLYSGLHVQIERVVADDFPEVYVDVAVEDRLGSPIVGLDASNFHVGEGDRAVEGPQLVSASHDVSRSQIALLLDKSAGMEQYTEELGEAASQLANGEGATLRVVSAGDSPVLEARSGSASGRIIEAAESAEGFTDTWTFDQGLYFAATSLLDTREHRAIVFVTRGELGQGAFQNYGLSELAALLRNNHVELYTVYVTPDAHSEELEFLSEESGGETMFLYRDDGIGGIPRRVLEHPSGRYTLRYTSGRDTDFGRAYIPLEVEAYLIRRSGRDEAGYFGPSEF
ncbi:MAG: VWA domain-containing protein [Spirochaetaceae bacterium]